MLAVFFFKKKKLRYVTLLVVLLETDNTGRGPQKAIAFKRAQTPTGHWSRENRG